MAEHETNGQGQEPVGEDRIILPAIADLESILGEQEQMDALFADDPELAAEHLGKTGLEAKAHIPSLEKLHHKRRVLARAMAPLAALFEGGQNASAEARRKQHRQVIGTKIAMEKGITGDKIESMLERLANADERHIRFCDDLERLKIKWFQARVALMEVNEEIRDREEAERCYRAEVNANLTGAGQT